MGKSTVRDSTAQRSGYWLKAPLPAALGNEVLRIVGVIRSGDYSDSDDNSVVDVVAGMTDAVIRYAFMRPVEAIELGFAARSVAEMAIRSSIKTTRYGLKMIIPRLNDGQRRQFASFLEAAIHNVETAPSSHDRTHSAADTVASKKPARRRAK